MISTMFWTKSGKLSFQFVDGRYRVYNQYGDAMKEFKGFEDMCDYIVLYDR